MSTATEKSSMSARNEPQVTQCVHSYLPSPEHVITGILLLRNCTIAVRYYTRPSLPRATTVSLYRHAWFQKLQ